MNFILVLILVLSPVLGLFYWSYPRGDGKLIFQLTPGGKRKHENFNLIHLTWMHVCARDKTDVFIIADEKKIFCYYNSFAQSRPSVGKFLPEDIDPELCTHIIFAFVNIVVGPRLKPANWNDLSVSNRKGGNIQILTNLQVNSFCFLLGKD